MNLAWVQDDRGRSKRLRFHQGSWACSRSIARG